MDFTTRYLHDDEVDDRLDRQLRALLLECFPHEAHHLETKRYFHQNPPHRWIAFDEHGTLVAHVAAHEKILGAGERNLKVIGIAEVCVAAQFRGQGLVKTLLQEAHSMGEERGFVFSVLLGDRKIYSSSGYLNAPNYFKVTQPETGQISVKSLSYFMYRPFGNEIWPDGEIDLRGPLF